MKELFLVEDNEDIREMVSFLLRSEGYKVNAFANLEDFLTALESSKPDLIVMDVMLPDGNGLIASERLGRSENTMDIPVIILSAHLQPVSIDEFHAKEFIPKPFELKDFKTRIRKHLYAAS